MKTRVLIPFVIFALLFLFLWQGLSLKSTQLPSALINKRIPAFGLSTFTDQDLSGHVSLLHVWATWCQACQQEHGFLMDLASERSIPIYAIVYKDNPLAVKNWLQQNGNPYKSVGFDQSGKISIDLGVYGTPETFVIDQKGIIRYKIIGALTPDIWHKEVRPLLLSLGA